MCSSGNLLSPIYFLCVTKNRSMLHHEPLRRVQSKGCWFMFRDTFLAFLCCFYQKMCFYHFYYNFFDKLSNLCKVILTSQKSYLMIRNCQWNCTLIGDRGARSSKWVFRYEFNCFKYKVIDTGFEFGSPKYIDLKYKRFFRILDCFLGKKQISRFRSSHQRCSM